MFQKSMKSSALLLASTAFLLTIMGGSSYAQSVRDKNNGVVGTLIATNTVLVTRSVNGSNKSFAVKFKSPGFDTYTEIDQSVVLTAYYITPDCTGDIYYSDQADGRWKRNLTPSIYDVPSTGIAIGVTASPVDPKYFSSIDFYYPSGSPTTVTVQSKKELGENSVPSQCLSMTSVADTFWKVSTVRISATPPFRAQ